MDPLPHRVLCALKVVPLHTLVKDPYMEYKYSLQQYYPYSLNHTQHALLRHLLRHLLPGLYRS